MSWYSLLPPQLTSLESWLVRIFVRLSSRSAYYSFCPLSHLLNLLNYVLLLTLNASLLHNQLVLGTLTIGPWLFLILYDVILYLWRAATYEIPVVGGRARGRGKPRAPSLSERGGREGDYWEGGGGGGDDGVGNEGGVGRRRRRRGWSLGVGSGSGSGAAVGDDGAGLVRRKTTTATATAGDGDNNGLR